MQQQIPAESQQHKEHRCVGAGFDRIVGTSPAICELVDLLTRVAPTQVPLLIEGEPGTGKHLVAEVVHTQSLQADTPMLRLHSAATSQADLEQALAQDAEHGTLLLDEIGLMPLAWQPILLAYLKSRQPQKVRVIALSSVPVSRCVDEGVLLDELCAYLAVSKVCLFPLRHRREDIPVLAQHFLATEAPHGKHLFELSDKVIELMSHYPWPGNVRELRDSMVYAIQRDRGCVIEASELPLQLRLYTQQTRIHPMDDSVESLCARLAQTAARTLADQQGKIYELVVGELQDHLIRVALEQNHGIKQQAAQWLGINRNTLHSKHGNKQKRQL